MFYFMIIRYLIETNIQVESLSALIKSYNNLLILSNKLELVYNILRHIESNL